MASLLQQAVRNEALGSERRTQGQRTEQEEDTFIPIARLAEESWRRVALRVFLLLQSVRLQFVVSELVALPNRRLRLKAPTAREGYVSKAEVFARGYLDDSTWLRGKTHMSKVDCPHDCLLPWGGRVFWYTCRDCPARWPRKTQEEKIDPTL